MFRFKVQEEITNITRSSLINLDRQRTELEAKLSGEEWRPLQIIKNEQILQSRDEK